MKALRYFLIMPVAISGLVLSGFLIPQVLKARVLLFCPTGFREGVDCYAAGWVMYPNWALSLFAMFTALFSILLSSLIAPAHKLAVAVGVYFSGSMLAIYLGVFNISGGAVQSMGYVLLIGLISVLSVWHLTRDDAQ